MFSDLPSVSLFNSSGDRSKGVMSGFDEGLDNILVDMAFDSIVKIIYKIPRVYKVDFEKDDDSLGHVQFVTECANIRNEQYNSDPETS